MRPDSSQLSLLEEPRLTRLLVPVVRGVGWIGGWLGRPPCWGKYTDWNCPPWPGTIVTICMSCFTTGGPGKEHGTNKPPPTGRVQEGQKETPHVRPPPRILCDINLDWTRRAPPGRTLELEWLAKDNPETNPISVKPETASHETELFSWVPLPCCSPPACSFPVKSLALSAHVSPQTVHFRVLVKSPIPGSGKGPPSCNIPM